MTAALPTAPLDLSPLTLSCLVAGVATVAVTPIGVWAAWRLSRMRRGPVRWAWETLLSLPLVLPPTVVGFALLLVLGRGTAFGAWVNETLHIQLLFTWQAAAIAATIMALPLLVRTVGATFASVDGDLLDAGRTLGATDATLLRAVLLPLSYRGLLAGITLAFARALGEFGATLMVAGSIQGRTQTLPLALYAATQSGDTRTALIYAALLTIISAGLLGGASAWEGQIAARRGER